MAEVRMGGSPEDHRGAREAVEGKPGDGDDARACPSCGREAVHNVAVRQVPGIADIGWGCVGCGHEWGFEVLLPMELFSTGVVTFATPRWPVGHMRCHLAVFGRARPSAVECVVFTEVVDNPGASVTNCTEEIAAQTAEALGVTLDQVTWVEHYSRRGDEPDVFDRIEYLPHDGPGWRCGPQWTHLGPDGFRRLLRLPAGAEIPL